PGPASILDADAPAHRASDFVWLRRCSRCGLPWLLHAFTLPAAVRVIKRCLHHLGLHFLLAVHANRELIAQSRLVLRDIRHAQHAIQTWAERDTGHSPGDFTIANHEMTFLRNR